MGHYKHSSTHILEVPKGEKKEKAERTFEETESKTSQI